MKQIIMVLALFSLLVLSGCGQTVAEIKSADYEGKTVSVSGTAENSIKIGQLSGYTLVDSNGDKIAVSTTALPSEGDKVTAKGTLIKDTIFGYYIKVN
ncbi:MAG: hypothetical protein GY861_06825 [bacterium]|nr:hypothetical protein [bacterium]